MITRKSTDWKPPTTANNTGNLFDVLKTEQNPQEMTKSPNQESLEATSKKRESTSPLKGIYFILQLSFLIHCINTQESI